MQSPDDDMPQHTVYEQTLRAIVEKATLGRGAFVQISGVATCALHAGDPIPDLAELVTWLEQYPPIEIDGLAVSNHTRDVALFGRTLAAHLLELRLEKRLGKRV